MNYQILLKGGGKMNQSIGAIFGVLFILFILYVGKLIIMALQNTAL